MAPDQRPVRPNADRVVPEPASWANVFWDQLTDEVQEVLDAARWWLQGAAADPGSHPPGMVDLFREIERDAAAVLGARRVAPAPTRFGAALDVVKRRLDLAGFLPRRAEVDLRPIAGGELLARCPFPDHQDRTPSFRVNPAKGVWHCFGCRRGGSVVDFELWWSGDDLRTVVARLAWEAGLGPHPDARRPEPARSPARPPRAGPVPIRPGGRRG